MATATPPLRTPNINREESRRRVSSPLQRMRGYIRMYVVAEAIAIAAIFMAAWFWIGVLFDYGTFRVFDLDWVTFLPHWVRMGLLALPALGLVALIGLKLFVRLFREFADPSLALVLERRYGKLLGDRLITAVELADLQVARKYGYSQVMVEHTVRDAAERVDQVAVSEVFDWSRLYRCAAIVLSLTVGVYLAAGVLYYLIVPVMPHVLYVKNNLTMLSIFGIVLGCVGFLLALGSLVWLMAVALRRFQNAWRPMAGLVFALALIATGGSLIYLSLPEKYEPIRADTRTQFWTWQESGQTKIARNSDDIRKRFPNGKMAETTEPSMVSGYMHDFADVAAIWFERNILLHDTIWPRRAHLDLVDFPKHVGTNAPPPVVRVRVYRWIIADHDRARAPEGWRPLEWKDLEKFQGALGVAVPKVEAPILPVEWRGTVDEIELQLEKSDLRQAEPTDDSKSSTELRDRIYSLDDLFQNLETLALSPSMSRTLRRLPTPHHVILSYADTGKSFRSDVELQLQTDNEYAGTLADLKANEVKFVVRAEDYATKSQTIRRIEPPTLDKIEFDRQEPAYIYYRPPVGGSLKGMKQAINGALLTVQGDVTRVSIPVGTDFTLRFLLDPSPESELLTPKDGKKPVTIITPKGAPEVHQEPHITGPKAFALHFENFQQTLDMQLEIRNKFEIVGGRRVVIEAVDDTKPDIDLAIDTNVIRKTSGGYMCTAKAHIPFTGNLRDDRGLTKASYEYAYTRAESQSQLGGRVWSFASPIPFGFGRFDSNMTQMALLALANQPSNVDEGKSGALPVAGFDKAVREADRSWAYSEDALKKKLATSLKQQEDLPRTLMHKYALDADFRQGDYFDVSKLNLNEGGTQLRYKLKVWMSAFDNNVENDKGPREGKSKEQFQILVVLETDLLLEINKEEITLGKKVRGIVDRLNEARLRLTQMELDIPDIREEFGPMIVRADQVQESADKSRDESDFVWKDYSRILRELQANYVAENKISEVDTKIVTPLGTMLKADSDFDQSAKSIKALQDALRSPEKDRTKMLAAVDKARDDIDVLIKKMSIIRDCIESIVELKELIERLTGIIGVLDRTAIVLRDVEEKINDILAGAKPKPKKDKEKDK